MMKLFIKAFLFTLFILFASSGYCFHSTYAATNNNVKECTENPETCEEDPLPAVDASEAKSTAVGLSIGDYIKMILALGFVIVLLYAILKWVNRNSRLYQQNKVVQTISGASVGQQKSVQVIKVGERYFLIGVGDNVQLLEEIDAQTIQSYVDQNDSESAFQSTSSTIMQWIKSLRNQFNQNKNENDSDENFQDIFNSKLKTIHKQRQKQLDRWKKEKDRS